MDLEQHRPRYSETQESCRAANSRRSCGNVEARASALGNVSAAARLVRPERRRALLLRMAGASGLRSVVGLGGAAQQIQPRACGGVESFGLVRRSVRTRWRNHKLQWAARRAQK